MFEDMLSAENPFSTRRIRPGAVAYCFPASVTVDILVDCLRQNTWWGEIVGPHGSGKSTLLRQLLAAVEHADRQPVLFELHDGQRSLPRNWRGVVESASPSARCIVVVDGYEQLGAWSRFRLKRYCRRRHFGLLVTSHLSVGLPDIFQTPTSLEIAKQVVKLLMQNQRTNIPDDVIAELFNRRHGNVRELLFDLYDLFVQK